MNRKLVIELLGLEEGKAHGFQEYIFNLLDFFYLHREDIRYEKIVIWCKDGANQLFYKYHDKFDVESFAYSSYLRRHWLQSVLPIKRGLDEKDLLFSPGNISGVVKRSKEILTIHDLLFKRKDWLPNKAMRWQREVLMPISIRKADRIVAISEFTKKDIENYYPRGHGKIEVIYNSFNFSKYEGCNIVSNDKDYFLAISTSADYKNQKTLLLAFADYCRRGGDKDLLIIGRINQGTDAARAYDSLSQEIKNRTIWKSNISNKELGSLYRRASCFVSASKFEGLGMPVVEAMSFGLPVLLSDIPPHREVSLNKGEYFKATEFADLAERMFTIDFSKRSYAAEIRSIYSEKNTSSKYVELINSIFEDTRRRGGVILEFRDQTELHPERRVAA